MKIGMIGLGAMGFPITKCLLKAGFEVYAFDVAEKALDEAAANGAHPCPDVAKSELRRRPYFAPFPTRLLWNRSCRRRWPEKN